MGNLKVGLVLDDSLDSNDGVQQYVRTLGQWLQTHGHAVEYIAGQSRNASDTLHSLSRNVSIKFNGNRLTTPLPANTKTVQKLLADKSFDILHVQMPYSPLMAGKVITNASSKTAVIGTFHILPLTRLHRLGNKTLGLVQKRQIRRLDAICSVSPVAQQFAKTHYHLTSQVIPNMIDLSRWQSVVRVHPKRIVFLGRLVKRKGCLELLRALATLPAALRGDVEVLIAGDGSERRKLEAYAAKHGLTEVIFLGYVNESQKLDLLASAEIAVFPSLGGESFGIVLIEAMAAGAGVVLGGNNPGYASVLADWPETLADPQDAVVFGKMIERFLTDASLRHSVHKSQQQAVKKYDANVVGTQILEMYKTALLHRRQEMR